MNQYASVAERLLSWEEYQGIGYKELKGKGENILLCNFDHNPYWSIHFYRVSLVLYKN